MTALYSAIRSKVKELIVGLGLTGIPDANIVETKLPWARNMVMPGVRVAFATDSFYPWTNEAYKTEYGIWVVYARVSNQNLTENLDAPNQWRQDITRLFQSRAVLSQFGIAGVYNSRVEAGTPIWDSAFAAQHDVGALKVIVTATEPR
mgnify:CR=1 FL=1